MNEKRNGSQASSGGLTLNDIYHVLFRHKWKIVVLSSLGLLAAVGIYAVRPSVYESHAKILIKSVSDEALTPNEPDKTKMYVTTTSDGLIMNEVAVLTSFDLSLIVASNITPQNILGKNAPADAYIQAAAKLHENISVDRPGKSSGVISIVLLHKDQDMVQRILKEVVSAYKEQHARIHAAAGSALDVLDNQTRSIHNQLVEMENLLQKKKNEAGVIDVDGSRKANESEIARIHEEIMAAAAELEQHKTMVKKLQEATGAKTAAVASTNSATNSTNVLAEVPHELIDRYRDTSELVTTLEKEVAGLRVQFSESNPLVKDQKARLNQQREIKRKMEEAEPRLTKLGAPAVSSSSGQLASTSSGVDPITAEQAVVASIESKIRNLQGAMADINTSSTNLESKFVDIGDLQRQVNLLEDKWKNSLAKLQNARMDADISSVFKNANIVTAEEPTPAMRERTKTPKLMAIAAASGIILGLLWAFVVELYLDGTVKRAKEIEDGLGMRLFLSIPDVTREGYHRLSNGNGNEVESNGKGNGDLEAAGAKANGAGKMDVAPWDPNHSLHDYYEALRDRLISYFDVNNLTHKPKLVAVSGPSRGCGTSTIAAGLAASLSETGDGNVLLVDMNLENGASQEFFKGKPGCELDAALQNETRDGAMIQNGLYMVNGTTNGDKLSRMLPKRFANLMPKLRASDYDYIIFDMPPISRTGVAQRLAGFMDMMILVVEAEKTNRDVVRQAGNLLNESKANVSVVLNKTRNYIPKRLHQEF